MTGSGVGAGGIGVGAGGSGVDAGVGVALVAEWGLPSR